MKRVLLISFYGPLCYSLRLLFERPASDDLEVVSALGMLEGMELCRHPRFDLLILCSSIPTDSQLSLIREFRRACPAPTVSMYNSVDSNELAEADYRIDAWEGPDHVLFVTSEILDSAAGSAAD